MEYRDIEYTVVQGIERGVWKWSVAVEGMIVAGQEQTRPEAIKAAEKAIDRATSVKKARPVPHQPPDRTPPDLTILRFRRFP